MKFRTLRAEDVEARISRVTKRGVVLLLYKDARCDMKILDETVGAMNWQKQYSRDNKNCTVSIWDDEKKQWISKEDTGTESYTEPDKGLASDSFKRACFAWGIGRELYTAPDIFFFTNEVKLTDGKCYDRFSVEDMEVNDGRITYVTVRDLNTNIIKEYGRKEEDKEELKKGQETISSLLKSIKATSRTMEWVFERYSVNDTNALTIAQQNDLIKILMDRKAEMEKEKKHGDESKPGSSRTKRE